MSDQPLGGLPLAVAPAQGQGPGLRAKTQNLADNPPAPGTTTSARNQEVQENTQLVQPWRKDGTCWKDE